MEAAHCGFQVAMRLNLLAMYLLLIDLTTAENVEGSGVTSRFWVEKPAWKRREKMSFYLAQSTF